jgi:leucyl aminopeptidase
MHPVYVKAGTTPATPILFVNEANYAEASKVLDAREQAFVTATGFTPKAGRHLIVQGPDGGIGGVLFGIEAADAPVKDQFRAAALVPLLPAGTYRFANTPHDARLAALSFALASYQFTRYRKGEARDVKLVVPDGVDGEDVSRMAEAAFLARDLINTPSNDLGPQELEDAARKLAGKHGAKIDVIIGADIEKNFPLIQAVGMGSPRAPRLIDITWGDASHPKVTLVGKGVCFDTGGLDIKPDASMLNMKKDMGGAATALGLAHMIMSRKLKVRLRVLIPAVENSISGASFRPRDIFRSRKGLTVEIGNTDAEGRLVLADALSLADEEKPELIIDFATLTGAARVALGPDLPAAFTDDDRLAEDFLRAGLAEQDPAWRLPLWKPYEAMLDSKVADTNNVSTGGQGGAITAALFLRKFVEAKSWLHLDVFAWNAAAKPGRPEGGELQTARALYAMLCQRYG